MLEEILDFIKPYQLQVYTCNAYSNGTLVSKSSAYTEYFFTKMGLNTALRCYKAEGFVMEEGQIDFKTYFLLRDVFKNSPNVKLEIPPDIEKYFTPQQQSSSSAL